jgi:hypothetical protein
MYRWAVLVRWRSLGHVWGTRGWDGTCHQCWNLPPAYSSALRLHGVQAAAYLHQCGPGERSLIRSAWKALLPCGAQAADRASLVIQLLDDPNVH